MIIPRRNEATDPCFKIPQMGQRLSTATPGMIPSWSYNRGPAAQNDKHSLMEARFEQDPGSSTGAIGCLENLGWLQQYPVRAPVFHHGDPAKFIYIVRQGRLKLSLLSRRGRCIVFRLALPGDFLGLSAILNHTDHQYLAQTLEPSVLVSVPRNDFLHVLHTVPEVNSFATQALARDHDTMLRAIRRLGMSASVRERLAQLLLNCAEFSRVGSLPLSIRISWTYGELGDMVNSSRETVTRIMAQFEREELIQRRGSLVVIRNEAKLQLLAG